MSKWAVQTTFNVPRATLQTYINKVTVHANPGRISRFTYLQERKLIDYVSNRIDMAVRFGKKQFLLYTGQYAKRILRMLKVESHKISGGLEFWNDTLI